MKTRKWLAIGKVGKASEEAKTWARDSIALGLKKHGIQGCSVNDIEYQVTNVGDQVKVIGRLPIEQ